MQVSFRKILLGSLIAATFSMPAAAEIKVGVVDIAKLFEESPQAKVVQESLQRRVRSAPSAARLPRSRR